MKKLLPAAVCAVAATAMAAAPATAAPPEPSGSLLRDAYESFAARASAARTTAEASPQATSKATGEAAPAQPEVVVSGLNNPRQLSLAGYLNPGNGLYIAEVGKGGDECVGEGEAALCFGTTGSITLVGRPAQQNDVEPRRIVTGLLSASGPDGSFAFGASGVSKAERGVQYSAVNFAPPELFPAQVPTDQAGKLLQSTWNGAKIRLFRDIAGFEAAEDPAGDGIESNPYAVLALYGGTRLVADAAGNTIVKVAGGEISTFAVIPEHDGGDGVPTSLAYGIDGNILVGELAVAGGPGAARVYTFSPDGEELGYIDGFTGIVGVAQGLDGSIYVSELFAGFDPGDPTSIPGQITKVAPDGARTSTPVPFPGGIAVDRDGRVYVAAWSIGTEDGTFGIPNSSGQVWRFESL